MHTEKARYFTRLGQQLPSRNGKQRRGDLQLLLLRLHSDSPFLLFLLRYFGLYTDDSIPRQSKFAPPPNDRVTCPR